MPPATADIWSDRVRDTLARYSEPLLRDVAGRLIRPRSALPAEELIEKCLATLLNPPVVDRRLREQPDAARAALALIGLGRRPTWKVGHLVALLAALGHNDGYGPVLTLLGSGLLYPKLPPHAGELQQFESI